MGTRRIRRVVLVAIATASLGLTATASAQTGEAQLVVMADGPGTVTASPAPTPIVGGNPCIGVGIEDSATGLDESTSRCVYGYAPGTVVTFTAAERPTPAGSLTRTFGGWSDFRCPAAPTCTLTIDGDGQSLVALFDPQIVGVRFAGSTLESADRERAAVSAAMRDRRSAGRASGVSGRIPPLHACGPDGCGGRRVEPGPVRHPGVDEPMRRRRGPSALDVAQIRCRRLPTGHPSGRRRALRRAQVRRRLGDRAWGGRGLRRPVHRRARLRSAAVAGRRSRSWIALRRLGGRVRRRCDVRARCRPGHHARGGLRPISVQRLADRAATSRARSSRAHGVRPAARPRRGERARSASRGADPDPVQPGGQHPRSPPERASCHRKPPLAHERGHADPASAGSGPSRPGHVPAAGDGTQLQRGGSAVRPHAACPEIGPEYKLTLATRVSEDGPTFDP